jgi:hypothetical protein
MKLKLWNVELDIPNPGLPLFIAVTTTLGFFMMVGDIIFHEVPAGSKEIAFTMLGAVAAKWGDIVGYYFGSSSGSAKKTDILAASAEANKEPQP